MAACIPYNGTCRACLAGGKFWFSNQNSTSYCVYEPHLCAQTISHIAETIGECRDPVDHTTSIISGVVLLVFFVVAMVATFLFVRRGCPTFNWTFRRGRVASETEPMIPMVRYQRSGSVYSLDLALTDEQL